MGCSSSTENDRSAVGGSEKPVNEADAAAALLVAGGQQLFSNLQLSIRCQGLHNKDKRSLSDPFVVCYLSSSDQPEWREVGRTEIQANSLAPQFIKMIVVTYQFEVVQRLLFKVYDADSSFTDAEASKTMVLDKQDYQGFAEVVLASLVGSPRQTWTADLLKGTPPTAGRGSITVRAEEMANANSLLQIDVHASGLANMDRIGRSDPFLVCSRLNEDGTTSRCYKTEVIMNNLAPTWARISVPMATLCNGDPLRPVQMEVWDWNSNGRHVLIGQCRLSVNDMVQASTSRAAKTLEKPATAAGQNNSSKKSPGQLHVDSCVVLPRPSFFDFISSGTELSFMVAVDFTASNGNPNMPDSRHYMDPRGGANNEYAAAITGVGQVLEFYSSTRLYPAYGFGGIPPGYGVSSHCFPLNGNEANPEVSGVDGILAAYRQALQSTRLSGPTLFAPMIQQAAALAASTASRDPSNQKYWVLLLLTDGLLGDFESAVQSIVNASALPLSIIIVGVGGEDFSAMHALDGDKVRLRTSSGVVAERDIVQFVPMREFAGRGAHALAKEVRLAKEVLAELPDQLLAYMKAKSILPPARQNAGHRQPSGMLPQSQHQQSMHTSQPPPPQQVFQAVDAPPPYGS